MKSVSRVLACSIVCGAALLFAGASHAQTWPARPVRIIVPFAPGGPTDVMARILAQKLSESFGQQFVVENRAGAGGNIGMNLVAKSAPDGYAVLLASSSYVVNPSLYAKAGYDPHKDFAPVTVAAASPNVLVVHPSVPARNAQELVALVRGNPGKHNYAQPGTGTTPHLSGELFRLTFKLDIVNVPFNGAGPAVASAVGNQTPIAFVALPPAMPHVKSGALRALAVTGARRSATLPDVPTMTESGAPDQEAETMQGVLLPAGTPREIVERLHREIVRAVALPEVKERLAALGFDAVANTPEEFAAYIRSEVDKWARVIREANIKIE
ncbi:MAG: tripartite tricarboxylate transporter substrate binding protein [Betaproteobacteria bacterium]|nr:tripartite tricarboxylate transporter substrate binding protein [Betaproteobacteria bacterium]